MKERNQHPTFLICGKCICVFYVDYCAYLQIQVNLILHCSQPVGVISTFKMRILLGWFYMCIVELGTMEENYIKHCMTATPNSSGKNPARI